ncbi:MAG: CHASE2 domain-containing protein [Leptolyngbya sp. SIO1D8]|nr:CHASE2 domain-containing protein [Leptolyngbya sp. SIO1D8]
MSIGDNTSSPQPKKQGGIKRLLQTVVLTSLGVTIGLTGLRFLGLFENLEIATYDTFIRRRPIAPLDDRLLVVGISEADIQGRQEYPIKEDTVIELITTLERYEPRAIALDFALDFPQGSDADRAQLTQMLASRDRVVSACLMSSEQSPGVPPAPGVIDELIGFADFPEDSDGITRRSFLVSTPAEVLVDEVQRSHLCNRPGEELLSLSLLLADIYLADEDIWTEQTDAGNLVWGTTVVPQLFERSGGYVSSGAIDYQVMLNYRAPRDAIRQVSLTDVLQDQVDTDWIRDRIVLVGYTSTVVGDILNTPYTETTLGFRGMFGVMVHAQATSQLISAALDGRPLIRSWSEPAEIGLILVGSLLGGLVVFYDRRLIVWVSGIFVIVALLWGLSYFAFSQGLWLPVVPMTTAVLFTAVVAAVVSQARQSVYVQAIVDQLKAEMTGAKATQPFDRRDRLDDLVRRAQAIRQQRAIGEILDRQEVIRSKADPLQLEFDSPEAQTFYEQIKTQLQQKFDEEKATLEIQAKQQKTSRKSAKLQFLLRKSQNTRRAHSIPPASKSGSSHE